MGTRAPLQALKNSIHPRPLTSHTRIGDLVAFHAALLGHFPTDSDLTTDAASVLCTAVNTHYNLRRRTYHHTLPLPPPERRLYLHVLQSVIHVTGSLLHLTSGYMPRSPRSCRDLLLRAQWTVSYLIATSPVHLGTRSGLHRYGLCAVPPDAVRPPNSRNPSVPAGYIYLLYHLGVGRWYIG